MDNDVQIQAEPGDLFILRQTGQLAILRSRSGSGWAASTAEGKKHFSDGYMQSKGIVVNVAEVAAAFLGR